MLTKMRWAGPKDFTWQSMLAILSDGWGFPIEINEGSRFFSTVYVLVGASVVAAALGFFGQSMIVSSKEWYNEALLDEEKHERDRVWHERLLKWFSRHDNAVKTIGLWVVWISAMILFSCVTVKWSFIDGLYFAVSSLSTGGLFAIPNDSPDWYFGIGKHIRPSLTLFKTNQIRLHLYLFSVGCFAATGIPLMGMAMGQLAGFMISVGDPDELTNAIYAKVTATELDMMKRFGLDDGDGKIDRGEFILLCAVRIGALSPDLIDTINRRFAELDVSGDGTLDYEEILETVSMKAKRLSASGGNSKAEGKRLAVRTSDVDSNFAL